MGESWREMELKRLILVCICVATFAYHTSPVASQEVEDEREFNYEAGDEHGPERWGLIHKEWEMCSKGKLQSPIDLLDEKVEVYHQLGRMRRTYRPSRATVVNRGHDIMLKWEDGAGGFWINGTEYTLNQLHWHSPSEHTLNNRRFDLELHMVHQAANNDIAVVGILYKIGRPDSFLTEMEEHIHAVKNREDHEVDAGIVDPRHVKRGSRKYYRYLGSLTTPPCTEGVAWTIVHKVRTASRKQLKLLREAVTDGHEENARPLQNFNDRILKFYRPWPKRY